MRATLTYHSIDPSGSPISVRPDAFAAHLQWFRSGRLRALPLDDLVTAPDDGRDSVAVAFDDGFANTRAPLEQLRAEGIPVTVFVVTGAVGGDNAWQGRQHPSIPTLPLLGWSDLEHLVRLGVRIEAHTRLHPGLSQVSDGALADELGGSRDDLSRRLGVDSVHVAYPYGDVDGRVVTQAATVFRFGHTTECRALAAGDLPLLLPRVDMYYFQSGWAVREWNRAAFARRVKQIGLQRLMRHGLLGLPAPGRPRRWIR